MDSAQGEYGADFSNQFSPCGAVFGQGGKDLWKDWRLDEADYAAIGGGFPIIVAGTGVVGAVACSGLPHEMDHQLLVDAICQILGVDLEAEM